MNGLHLVINKLYLPPAKKLGQGNIFRSMCQEFCSRGRGRGGSPGQHPGGRLRGLAGGLQAHTQGDLQAHTWEGGSSPTPTGSQTDPGGSPDPHPCTPACNGAYTPWQTATAVGGTHPTGI